MSRETSPPRVLMVVTRDLPAQSGSGRERTLAFIRSSLAESGEIQWFRIESLLEKPSLRRALLVLWTWISGLLRGRPVPLQSLLFFDSRHARALLRAASEDTAATIYFDGVRSGIYARLLRHHFPTLRIVCDFDDLMSRRMAMIAEAGQRISLGYLGKWMPDRLQRYLFDGVMARLISGYESRALLSTEREIAACCDKVVLVSNIDGKHFLEDTPTAPLEIIPPFMATPRLHTDRLRIQRFIFIGSDSLLQNQKSIDYLLTMWEHLRPFAPLYIYGKQSRRYTSIPPNVQFEGFVDSLDEVYTAQSLLLAPSFVSGGVKTKVLEAMSYGVIPVGTMTTFEGIAARMEELAFDEAGLNALVKNPAAFEEQLDQTGMAAISEAGRNHSPTRLGLRWKLIVWPQVAH